MAGRSRNNFSPLPEPVLLSQHSSWPEDDFPLHPATAGVRSLSQAFPSVVAGAEHPSSLQGGYRQCGELQPSLHPGLAKAAVSNTQSTVLLDRSTAAKASTALRPGFSLTAAWLWHMLQLYNSLAWGKPGVHGGFAFLPPKAAFSRHLPTIPRDSTVKSASFMLEQGVGCRGERAAALVTDCPLQVCDGSGTAFCPFYRGTALAVFAEVMT